MDSFELNKILGALLGTCLVLLAVHIAHAILLSERRRHTHLSAAFHEFRIADKCCDHSSDKFGTFAIGEIEPSACSRGHH